MNRLSHLILTLLLSLSSGICYSTNIGNNDTEPDPIEVYWVTASVGRDVYELEGHSALRIRVNDSIFSKDFIVNWGLFDFNSPAFVWRFALGETDYLMGLSRFDVFNESYRSHGRQLTLQRLNIDTESAKRLIQLVDSTLADNPVYRYNYVLDNCATRPLDYIEKATGKNVRFSTPKDEKPTTFRSEMSRYHAQYPWYQFGIDLALGSGIDKPISTRERGFAPIEMQNMLLTAQLVDSAGFHVPFITESIVLESYPIINSAPDMPSFPSPLSVGWILLLLIAISIGVDLHRRVYNRWVSGIFFSVETIAGCIIAFLVFVSSHYATAPNFVLLWLNPLAIIGVVGAIRKRLNKTICVYHTLNILAIVILSIIFITGIQHPNAAFWPLMISSAMLSGMYIYTYKKQN